MSRIIEKTEDLRALAGQEIGVSDWLELTQHMFDDFSPAAGGPQWLHPVAEPVPEAPLYDDSVEHGFLTLSIMGSLRATAFEIREKGRLGINYGMNHLRFPAPGPCGSRIRGRFGLASYQPFEGGVETTWNVTVEREGGVEPVLVAEWITRTYL